MEIWKDVVGYEGLYQVSNLGRVRTFHYGAPRIRVQFLHPKYNYWALICKRNGVKKTIKVHRMVAQAFIPNPDNKPQVNHLDCDRANNRLENLEWVTPAENVRHAGLMGRMARDQRGKKNANYRHGRKVSTPNQIAA